MKLEEAMAKAILEAKEWEGQTTPNPPVGAVILDENLEFLSSAAHQRAGESHAEILAINKLLPNQKPHTLVVTLEPCHHQGKTPPCTSRILEAGIKQVVAGVEDPNPHVQGGGLQFLKSKGLKVSSGLLRKECQNLIEGFWIRSKENRPMMIVKTAWTEEGSMIPPAHQKTFTSSKSIRLAHQLRKSADAILSGSGTILADDPLFTVREIPDFENKHRDLIFLDRRKRVSETWKSRQKNLGFSLVELPDLDELYDLLRQKNYLKVLVEAGPSLTESILKSELWDLHVKISKQTKGEDQIEWIYSEAFKNLMP
ncbi:MAG: bifunctional diaminohydroxyphosphoribosylaminopyrimidine deaminase/5-amino-6-(5-phosphoribosylamino)uracil reductase RibD [Bdellovibrionota bacterium]